MHGRYLEATAEEITAATQAVEAALRHPIVRRAAAAAALGLCRREVPVAVRLPDGSVADGIVDLTFREGGEADAVWTIVDFKTDVEASGRRQVYQAQTELYARAVTDSTGASARAVLLSV